MIPPRQKYVPKAHLFREKHRQTASSTSSSSGNDSGIDECENKPRRRLTPQERLAKLEQQERELNRPKSGKIEKEYSTREMDRMLREWYWLMWNGNYYAVNSIKFEDDNWSWNSLPEEEFNEWISYLMMDEDSNFESLDDNEAVNSNESLNEVTWNLICLLTENDRWYI